MTTPPLPSNEFVLADLEFCRWVAGGFEKKKHAETARAWTELGLKIERVLVGEYAQFTKLERDRVISLHTVAIKHAGVPGAKETSRGCSRLGILIQWALRGSLEQLRTAGGAT